MCGIVGIWRLRGCSSQDLEIQIAEAVSTLAHRGPDDQGVWVDESAGLALGQRRLSILDLSPAGHQPMFSPDGRLVLVYNGEVYNFQDLREELRRQGYPFTSDTDTEVILAAFAAWGVEQAVSRFVGMFALALWDRQEQQLWLVRDRLGIKPLYFHYSPGLVLFASELKAMMSLADFPRDLDFNALNRFFRYLYIPNPYTVFQGTKKLYPGQYARIDRNGLELKQYWTPRRIAYEGLQHRLNLSDMEAEEELDRLIHQSVRLRMIADVPLGAFLSGGIDSSTVVSVMQAESSRPVKTFTICFAEEYFDEGSYARRVAAHLGTDHTELCVTPEITQGVIPLLPSIYDEPFADASAIPTYLVSKLARQDVTVALSGDGGDELFGGYLRYYHGRELWRRVKNLPPHWRVFLARLLEKIPARNLEKSYLRIRPFLPSNLKFNLLSERLKKVAALLRARTDLDVHRQVASFWHDPRELLLRKLDDEEDEFAGTLSADLQSLELAEKMMLIDLQTYLPEDVLTKVDRASMMVSLEARVPLLDHRLVAWAWRLPCHFKIRNGQGKWLLRRVLNRYVPAALFERAKAGFGIPIGPWLRTALKDWGEELLDPTALKEEGILNHHLVRECWEKHQSGAQNNQTKLWPVLMFRAWKRRWLG